MPGHFADKVMTSKWRGQTLSYQEKRDNKVAIRAAAAATTGSSSGRAELTDVYVGRQPIVTSALRLAGYELLYRDATAAHANFADGDVASYQVAARTIVDMGFDSLVGAGDAFVNATGGFLAADGYRLLPAERTVVELLEDVEVDEDVASWAAEACRHGYRLALDDYAGPSSHDRLGPLASFVKVDVLKTPPFELDAVVDHLRRVAPFAQLVAEKLETAEDLERCRLLGFDLFQGYLLGRPERRHGRQVPASSLAALRLMGELQREDIGLRRLCELIEADPVLAYRLLRLINAAASAPRRPVTSVHHATVLLGLDEVRRLAAVLALTTATAAPSHLVEQLVLRAKMCQQVADSGLVAGAENPATAFTAGLFSELDSLLGAPMAELLSELPLERSVQSALLDEAGPLGDLVSSARAYDAGRFESIIPPDALGQWRVAFEQALTWTASLRAEISGPRN